MKRKKVVGGVTILRKREGLYPTIKRKKKSKARATAAMIAIAVRI